MQRCWRLKPRLDGPVGREVRVCGLGGQVGGGEPAQAGLAAAGRPPGAVSAASSDFLERFFSNDSL